MMLLEYMPKYYANSKVLAELLKAFVVEIEANNYAIEDLENQLFIETATWGLDIWEREFCISKDINKSLSERREILKAKMRGSGTCTIEMIKNTALAYTNAEIEVMEDNPNYTFIIKFISVKGIPPDIKAFKNTIESIKPAHMVYKIEYRYTTWGELKKHTWGDLKRYTWEQVKTMEDGGKKND